MNKEIADLRKREGVNPVSGCLPLLVQLPFLWANYRMLWRPARVASTRIRRSGSIPKAHGC